MEYWSSPNVKFDLSILSESDRVIEGVASAPIFDRANELITADALKAAAHDYLVLPVVTVGHREFNVGMVEDDKLWFDKSNQMHIRVRLKPTPDVDGVWELIKQGVLNAFSISGIRKNTTCNIDSHGMSNVPCVTSGIYLNSITICGDDKCNPAANFQIAKALGIESMTEENKPETPVVPEVAAPSLDYNLLAKTIVSEMNLQKECEKKEEEHDSEKDMLEKTLNELKSVINSQAETIKSFSDRLEKIEAIPFTKSIAFKDVDGHITAVSADDFANSLNKTVANAPETKQEDPRDIRRTTFMV